MSVKPTEEELDDEESARLVRRSELAEQHAKLPPWNAEAERVKRVANLRPLSEKHWQSRKYRLTFLRAGWRRLFAKQAATIAEQEATIEMLELSMAVREVAAVRRVDLLRSFSVEDLVGFKEQWDWMTSKEEEESDQRLASEAQAAKEEELQCTASLIVVCGGCNKPLSTHHLCLACCDV